MTRARIHHAAKKQVTLTNDEALKEAFELVASMTEYAVHSYAAAAHAKRAAVAREAAGQRGSVHRRDGVIRL
jgi:hypothetical protein